MEHVNPVMWQYGGLKERLAALILPETYVAATISDFLRERQGVQTTSLLKSSIATHIYGDCCQRTFIVFHNVNYRRLSHDRAQFLDQSSRINLNVPNPKGLDKVVEKEGISDGDLIQFAAIKYKKRYDEGDLLILQKFLDIESPEGNVSENPFNYLVPALG